MWWVVLCCGLEIGVVVGWVVGGCVVDVGVSMVGFFFFFVGYFVVVWSRWYGLDGLFGLVRY